MLWDGESIAQVESWGVRVTAREADRGIWIDDNELVKVGWWIVKDPDSNPPMFWPEPPEKFDVWFTQPDSQRITYDEMVALELQWGEHERDGGAHTEWYAPCGCSYHPKPFPHVHTCSDSHKCEREERAIVAAAREWATAWGKVWEGDESATDEVNDKSKSLHDAVLVLEREIVLRRRREIMPDYDKRLAEWLS